MQRLRTCAARRPDTVGYRDPVVATKLALKYLARRILDLNDEIAELDRFIVPLVEELAPNLLELEGVGTENAVAIMVAVGDNPDRLCSEASFAMMCGVCPIPASSGKTQRHRLNRGGTLEWVDWFNNQRLLGPIGNIPPAEAEANHYAASENLDMAA